MLLQARLKWRVFIFSTVLETHAAVAYVPNLFGEESILVIGGGKLNQDTSEIEEENPYLESYSIKRTNDPSNPLEFKKTSHKYWSKNIAPYIQVLEDKIVIVQGGTVRQKYNIVCDDLCNSST